MNNQVYLSKLIRQEAFNVKHELFKENLIELCKDYDFVQKLNFDRHITKDIREKALLEYFTYTKKNILNEISTDSRSEDTGWPDINQINKAKSEAGESPIGTWEDAGLKDAALYLESIGATPFLAGTNPYGYELDTSIVSFDIERESENPKVIAKTLSSTDRLWFYTNGRVWSSNATITMGWKLSTIGSNFFKEMDLPDDTVESIKDVFEQHKLDTNEQYICIYNVSEQTNIQIVPTKQNGLIRKGEKTGPYPEKATPVYNSKGNIKQPEYISFDFIQAIEKMKTKTAEKEGKKDWLDKLQTALDWLGMIPVVGDAIDIINACIYFVRYAWSGFRVNSFLYQGLLSCIAIIPVVGSAISGIIKTIWQKFIKFGSKGVDIFKVLFFGKSIDKVASVYKLMKTHGIKLSYLKMMGVGLSKFGKIMRKAINRIAKVPGLGWIKREMGPIAETMAKHDMALAKMEREFVEAGAKAEKKFGKGLTLNPANAVKAYEKNPGLMNKISGGVYERLKQGNLWPSEKMKHVADTLTTNYKRSAIKNSPETFVTFSKASQTKAIQNMTDASSDVAQSYKELTKTMSKKDLEALHANYPGLKKLQGQGGLPNMKELEEIMNLGSKKRMNVGNNMYLNTKQKEALMKYVETLKKGIADQAVDLGHITYQAHRNSSLKQIQAAMWNTASGKGFWSGQVNPYTALTSGGKSLDVIYNEAEDVAERLGVRWEDENLDYKQGIIVPLMMKGVDEYLPGVSDSLDTGKELVKGIVGFAKETIPNVAGFFADMVGVDSGQFQTYNPSADDSNTHQSNLSFE